MSLAYTKIEPVSVVMPQLDFDANNKYYSVLKGAKLNYYKQWVSTSFSNSSITFSLPPNSNQSIIDRRMWVRVPIRITFTAQATAVGQTILNYGKDAPRQYPFSACIDTTNFAINQNSITTSVGELIHPLSKFNVDEELENGYLSMGFSYPDQSTSYDALNGSVRNPLGGYGDSTNHNVNGRAGGVNWVIVANPAANTSNAQLTAIVDIVTTEPLFLISPMLSGKKDYQGLTHVNNMDITLNMLTAQQRIWSRDETSTLNPTISYQIGGTNTLVDGGSGSPSILALYYTLQDNQLIPRDNSLVYPYYNIVRYTTDNGASIPSKGTTTLISNSIQLPSIPKKVYIFARERNQDLYSNATACDSFFAIKNINITFQNQTGIFSSASPEQLYAISKRNKCNMSYEQWSGGYAYNSSFSTQVPTLGSVFCAEFGYDINLESALDAPGKANINSTFSVNVSVVNQAARAITPTLYVVIVYDGIWNISNNLASTQTALLTSNNVLDALKKPFLSYNDMDVTYGDGILDDVGNFFKKAFNFVKDNKIISTIGKGIGSVLPGPIGAIASGVGNIADHLGFGYENQAAGGDLVEDYHGGEHMNRHDLKRKSHRKIIL